MAHKKITVGTFSASPTAIGNVATCLKNGRISQGKYVAELEKVFALYHDVKECVAVSTGTAADTLALARLQDWDMKKEWPVVLPALTFVSCANSVMHAGFRPVFADINLETYQINPEKAKDTALKEDSKIVMPVHLFGKPTPMDEIMDYRWKYIIEDCAEALGARYKGKLVGTFGDVGTFSFYIAHIITSGEGGAVITNDEAIGENIRSLRAHGRSCNCKQCVLNIDSKYCPKRFNSADDKRFNFERVGYSEKMNELEAILGLDQVADLNDIIAARRVNLRLLNCEISKYEGFFQLFKEKEHESISPLCYPLLIKKGAPFTRKEITNHLESHGIETRPMFSSIPTQVPAYKFLGYKYGDFPNAEYVGENGFYIGVHQNLTGADLEYILDVFKKFMELV